jgi:Ca-activated chloride channel family protein
MPLLGTVIDAEARGGLCRVVLRQRFQNPHAEPLNVTYSLPVPEDAAVSGFCFQVGDRRIVGEVDRRASARRRFEDAILEGRTAALLDEERSTIFSQEIGNIPPGAELEVEIEIDQHLRWLEEGQWELRIPTTVAPRYLGAKDRVKDAVAIRQDVTDGSSGVQLSLCLSVLDDITGDGAPLSPSHSIVASKATGGVRVGFAEETMPLDRDVVVRWQVARPTVGAQLTLGHKDSVPGSAFGLLSLVPPLPSASALPIARDLVLLLDTSGSMSGAPLDQAKRTASVLVGSMTERDTLEMIQFSYEPRAWKHSPMRMDEGGRRQALAWIRRLSASGGTEMREGILAALKGLNVESQRQVVLVTDGLIGFEEEIVAAIVNRLPSGSRVHTVGVGSGVNRTLTAGAARAGRGVEVILGLGEDPEPAAMRLNERTRAPVVVDLELSGSGLLRHFPSRLPDLFQGAPARIGLELSPAGGKLHIRGRSSEGPWAATLEVLPCAEGSRAIAKLYGREKVNDLEMRIAAGESGGWEEEIERTGLVFQVATRLTSWVAIDEVVSVDPDVPTRRERVPQQLAHGMSAEGLGLRSPGSGGLAVGMAMTRAGVVGGALSRMRGKPAGSPPPAGARLADLCSDEDDEVTGDVLRVDSAPPVRRSEAGYGSPSSDVPQPPQFRSRLSSAQPPTPPPPAECLELKTPTQEKGFLRKTVDALRDFLVPEPAAEVSESLASDEIARILLGRIVVIDARHLVLEATVDIEGLDWERPVTVELAWSDGTRHGVQVKQGTRSGRLEVGTSLRLVLVLDGLPRADAPAAVRVSTSWGVIAIEF